MTKCATGLVKCLEDCEADNLSQKVRDRVTKFFNLFVHSMYFMNVFIIFLGENFCPPDY